MLGKYCNTEGTFLVLKIGIYDSLKKETFFFTATCSKFSVHLTWGLFPRKSACSGNDRAELGSAL